MNYQGKFVTVECMPPSPVVLFFPVQLFSAFLDSAGSHGGFHLYFIFQHTSFCFCIIKLTVVQGIHFFFINTSSYNSHLEERQSRDSFRKNTWCFYNRGGRNSLPEDRCSTLVEQTGSDIIVGAIGSILPHLLNNTHVPCGVYLSNVYRMTIGRSFVGSPDALHIRFVDRNELNASSDSLPEISLFIAYYRAKDNRHKNLKVRYGTLLNGRRFRNLTHAEIDASGVRSNFQCIWVNFYE